MYQMYFKDFDKSLSSVNENMQSLSATFRDFCKLSRMCFQQGQYFDEERENEIIKMQRASKNPNGYAEALSVLVEALEYRTGDFLGEWAGLNNALNIGAGQVFTPYYVSKMMAEITIVQKKEEEHPIVINEPTCGSGGIVIASFEVLRDKGFSPKDFYIVAQDIDIHCVDMTFIQCSLLDIPAIILHGNSLTLDIFDKFQTMSFERNHILQI